MAASVEIGHVHVMIESFNLRYSDILSDNQGDCEENKEVTGVRSDRVSLLSLERLGLSQRNKP